MKMTNVQNWSGIQLNQPFVKMVAVISLSSFSGIEKALLLTKTWIIAHDEFDPILDLWKIDNNYIIWL